MERSTRVARFARAPLAPLPPRAMLLSDPCEPGAWLVVELTFGLVQHCSGGRGGGRRVLCADGRTDQRLGAVVWLCADARSLDAVVRFSAPLSGLEGDLRGTTAPDGSIGITACRRD